MQVSKQVFAQFVAPIQVLLNVWHALSQVGLGGKVLSPQPPLVTPQTPPHVK
ncbi:MAG TPA: hypothetical protein VFA43_02415 [Gemmatimonadaceae bacterium]|nr:hypothetical protein [Gemmatimonadaceae bacterium]